MTVKKTNTQKKTFKLPAGALTLKQLVAMFGVGYMTIHNWRKGTVRKTQLPSHSIPRGQRTAVYFKHSEVKAWARKNSVEIISAPDA